MRGYLLVLLTLGLLLAGCSQQPPAGNETNGTNVTPPVKNCTGPVCGSDLITYATDCEAELADVSILYSGECVIEENCTDSDGGLNASVSGTAVKGNESGEDYCVDAESLMEYSCADNAISSATMQCAQGEICRDGACEAAPPPEPEPQPNITAGCVGPGQEDIYKKENVTMNGTAYTDYCIEFQVVKGYYCEGDKLQSISHECPAGYGCVAGQCEYQKFECTDSDGGKNLTKDGNVVVVHGINTVFKNSDECVDKVILKEYFCNENGSASYEEIDCGSGLKCLSGKCVKSMCNETDGGLNIYKRGVTTVSGEDYEDECLSDYDLQEYYCQGDEVTSDVERCPKGYICNRDMHRCNEGSID